MPTRHHRFEALPKDPILYFSKMLKAFNAFTYVYFLDLSKFAHKSITKEQITGQTELIRRCSNLAILNLNFHPSHFYHRDIRSSQSPYEGPTSQQPNQLSYITCRFRLDGIFALSKLKLLSVQQDYDEEVVRKVDPEVEGGKHHVMNMLEMWFKAGFKEQGRNVVCLWECRNNAS
ncbi:hypothetical protein EJ08DRAFT_651231 [Tothia fuscella]|uniref:Uncharacterized protein n=1 Tax=Tothia fuscella TaxID=1048955 RepID=A0A9P4NMY8_9PEZI|nr:hypothetical protein EJ08DRAFT_651231 [Tothia fuscella]